LIGDLGVAQSPSISFRADVVGKEDQIDESQDAAHLLKQYAIQVNSLVEAYQNGLQLISAAVDAGELTPEQGQVLADEGVRFVASRLESFTDLYESLLLPDDPDDMGEARDREAGHSGSRMLRVHRLLSERRKTRWSIAANPDEASTQDARLTAF